jgi:hypothetical protein
VSAAQSIPDEGEGQGFFRNCLKIFEVAESDRFNSVGHRPTMAIVNVPTL